MSRGKNIAVGLFALWGGLGAYRGHQFYNQTYQRDLERHNKYYKDIYPEPKHYYMINVGFMVCGAAIYAMPYCAPFTILKELFAMEDFMRGRDTD